MSLYSDLNQATAQTQPLVVDVDAVKQSLVNILRTRKGERLFNPEFGAQLDDLLFEPIDDITASRILAAVVQGISRWDPRLEVDYGRSVVEAVPEELRYNVTLVISIRGLGGRKFDISGVLERPLT